ncbi:hypothetical protein LXA43DRAFT_1066950 [Ganoderma leucocontextum]|nr:hypothetical protein LXA43DRAFT_1066950 [Ganoderma leucocontextum]
MSLDKPRELPVEPLEEYLPNAKQSWALASSILYSALYLPLYCRAGHNLCQGDAYTKNECHPVVIEVNANHQGTMIYVNLWHLDILQIRSKCTTPMALHLNPHEFLILKVPTIISTPGLEDYAKEVRDAQRPAAKCTLADDSGECYSAELSRDVFDDSMGSGTSDAHLAITTSQQAQMRNIIELLLDEEDAPPPPTQCTPTQSQSLLSTNYPTNRPRKQLHQLPDTLVMVIKVAKKPKTTQKTKATQQK